MSLSPTAPTQGSMLHPKCHSHGSPAAHTFPTNGSLGKKFTASLPSLMGFPNQILLFKQPGSNLKPEDSCARCLDESHLKAWRTNTSTSVQTASAVQTGQALKRKEIPEGWCTPWHYAQRNWALSSSEVASSTISRGVSSLLQSQLFLSTGAQDWLWS